MYVRVLWAWKFFLLWLYTSYYWKWIRMNCHSEKTWMLQRNREHSMYIYCVRTPLGFNWAGDPHPPTLYFSCTPTLPQFFSKQVGTYITVSLGIGCLDRQCFINFVNTIFISLQVMSVWKIFLANLLVSENNYQIYTHWM